MLTTCAIDHFTWADHHPEGTTVERGVPVRRFRVDPGRDGARWLALHTQIDLRIPTGFAEQVEWMGQSVWSPGLQEAAEDAGRYDWLVCMPYLFGTTFWAAAGRPERTALIPCVHDEPHAWVPAVRRMLGAVRGYMLNSPGEGELLARLGSGCRDAAGGRRLRRDRAAARRRRRSLLRRPRHRAGLPALRRPARGGEGPPASCSTPTATSAAAARTRRPSP